MDLTLDHVTNELPIQFNSMTKLRFKPRKNEQIFKLFQLFVKHLKFAHKAMFERLATSQNIA